MVWGREEELLMGEIIQQVKKKETRGRPTKEVQMQKMHGMFVEMKEELRQKFEEDPLLFGRYYFPEYFRKRTPSFHLKILIEAIKNKFFAIAAPRGSAKSTILLFLYLIHRVAFKKVHFVIIVSNTFSKASQALEAIKSEFKHNESFRRDFGCDITKDREGDSVLKFTDGHEIRILCKGSEQIGSIRGEKFGAYRPDLMLIDDLEDDEMVRNPDRRRELCELYDEALIKAGEPGVTQVIAIGTILHDDSLMAKLVSCEYYKEYRKLLYRARYEANGETLSLWDDKWTVDDLNEEEQRKPQVFAKEMQNDPVSGLMSQIDRKDFRYWSITEGNAVLFDDKGYIKFKYSFRDCKPAIACDLAWEEKRTSDFSVIMPGFLTPGNDLLIDNYICKKGLRPQEIYEILFSMEERLRSLTGSSVPIGFEKAKLEKVIKHLLKQEMRKRNKYLIFKDLAWDKDKNERILTRLQPRYSQHTIYHRHGMGELENQIVRVPHGVHDDLPDAEQDLVQLLDYPKKVGTPQSRMTEFDQLIALIRPKKRNRLNKFQVGRSNFELPAIKSYK